MNDAHERERVILVTGATGFLGAHVITKLAKQNADCKIVCLIPQGSTVKVASAGSHDDEMQSYFRKIGAVCHPYPARGSRAEYQEALSGFTNIASVVYLAANNARQMGYEALHADNVGVLSTFVEALGDRLRNARFVFTSSVMAEATERLTRDFGEDRMRVIQSYGSSKLEAERLLLHLSSQYGFRLCILRLASVYGAGSQFGLVRSLHSLARMSRKLPIPYLGGRASVVHVGDAAVAVVRAVTDEISGTYGVTDAETVAVGTMVERVASERARSFRMPRLLTFLLRNVLDLAMRCKVAVAIDIRALIDDIYVSNDRSIWDVVSHRPRVLGEIPGPQTNGKARVGILGASGFIGSEIARGLMLAGVPIRCGLRHAPLPFEALDQTQVEEFRTDTAEGLASFANGLEVIVYAAGLTTSHGPRTWQEYLDANVRDVLTMLSLARAQGAHVIFLASQAPAAGRYGLSKSLGEHAVKTSGTPYTILKPGLVVGRKGLVKTIISISRSLRVIPVPYRAPRNTELVDVRTVAAAVQATLMELPQHQGRTYFVGSDQAVSFGDIVDRVGTLSNKRVLKVPVPRMMLVLAGSTLGLLIPSSPLTSETIEGLYRARVKEHEHADRILSEDPSVILSRYI